MSDTDAQVPLPDLNAADARRSTIWPTTRTNRPRASRPTSRPCSTCRCRFGRARPLQDGCRRAAEARPRQRLKSTYGVGEAIDIYVNNRLVARGEVVLVEDKLGVTMTEIIKAERS